MLLLFVTWLTMKCKIWRERNSPVSIVRMYELEQLHFLCCPEVTLSSQQDVKI